MQMPCSCLLSTPEVIHNHSTLFSAYQQFLISCVGIIFLQFANSKELEQTPRFGYPGELKFSGATFHQGRESMGRSSSLIIMGQLPHSFSEGSQWEWTPVVHSGNLSWYTYIAFSLFLDSVSQLSHFCSLKLSSNILCAPKSLSRTCFEKELNLSPLILNTKNNQKSYKKRVDPLSVTLKAFSDLASILSPSLISHISPISLPYDAFGSDQTIFSFCSFFIMLFSFLIPL
jgi:hypothetical protein